MYIEPSTDIYILKNVPLDTTYEHTIYFTSESAQFTYFYGLKKYALSNYTYQRVKRGYARVGIKAENLYDCNYIMYRNTAFGTKWFYAYITSVEYVNNECSEISFEIDVMQTWFFQHTPDYCWVAREHSATDNVGDNIVPEAFDLGEYVANNEGQPYGQIGQNWNNMCTIVAVLDTVAQTQGSIYDGIYSGADLYVFNSIDFGKINELVQQYLEAPDNIIAMYTVPLPLIGSVPADNKLTNTTTGEVINITLSRLDDMWTIDGYTPKNNKMFTYPYNFLHIDNANGQELNLRYEYFSNLTPTVQIRGCVTQPVSAILRPTNYKRASNIMTESLSLGNYPLCSWKVDSYQAWVAQNAIPMTTEGLAKVGGAVTAFALGGPIGGTAVIASASAVALNMLSQGYKASIAADILKGSITNGNVNVATKTQAFYAGRFSISTQYAKCIDDYWSMFGYATNRIKIPNRNSRPHWNYVKTVGCTVTGSVPADDMKKICQIYDNGITFWKNGDEVGMYSLDNTV